MGYITVYPYLPDAQETTAIFGILFILISFASIRMLIRMVRG